MAFTIGRGLPLLTHCPPEQVLPVGQLFSVQTQLPFVHCGVKPEQVLPQIPQLEVVFKAVSQALLLLSQFPDPAGHEIQLPFEQYLVVEQVTPAQGSVVTHCPLVHCGVKPEQAFPQEPQLEAVFKAVSQSLLLLSQFPEPEGQETQIPDVEQNVV